MSFAVVTVETASGEKIELALPLDVPSRAVAAKIMRDLGKPVRTGETFELFIPTGHGDKRILPAATLGDVGIADGQHLRVKRAAGAAASMAPGAYAYLRTERGDLLALDASNVIIGRKDARLQVPLDLDLSRYDPGGAVSRRHACIAREAANCYLLDLQSTNGTRLNGQAVLPGKKMPLQDGDTIEFGLGVRVTFVTVQSAAAKHIPG